MGRFVRFSKIRRQSGRIRKDGVGYAIGNCWQFEDSEFLDADWKDVVGICGNLCPFWSIESFGDDFFIESIHICILYESKK